MMAKSLRTLKMPLFLGFLRDTFKMHFSDVLEEEVLKYTKIKKELKKN